MEAMAGADEVFAAAQKALGRSVTSLSFSEDETSVDEISMHELLRAIPSLAARQR